VKKKLLIATIAAGLLVLTAGAAFAGQVNGTGKTHLGNTAGFNAKSDLTGSFEYNGDPNGPQANINAHCDDYDSYTERSFQDKWQNPGTYPAVRVSTTGCMDQLTGQSYKITAVLVDEGEPGTFDIACVRVFDLTSGVLLVHDKGYIESGNIQIHEDTGDSELIPTTP
jgi:hypothetical protein